MVKNGLEAVVKVQMEDDNDTHRHHMQFAVIEQLHVYNAPKNFQLRAFNQLHHIFRSFEVEVHGVHRISFFFFVEYVLIITVTQFFTSNKPTRLTYIIEFTFLKIKFKVEIFSLISTLQQCV